MKSPIRQTSLIATTAIFLLAIPAYAQDTPPAGSQTQSSADQLKTVLGYLEPIEDRTLTTSEAGRISEIFLDEGDPVTKGQPILKLDTAAHDSGLEIAKLQRDSNASVDAAIAERDLAQIKLDSLMKLNPGSRGTAETLRAKANLQIAEAKLQSAQEEKSMAAHQVTKLEGEIARRYIVSPVDGIVVSIKLDVSEFLSPSEEWVVHVARLDKLRLVVHVHDIYTRALRKGMPLPVQIAGEEAPTTGIIEFIDITIDPASGTRRVKLLVENPDLKYLSGSQAHVTVARIPAP